MDHKKVSATWALMLTVMAMQPAKAQTYAVLHRFTGGGDGANPRSGLTLDQAGNFYGTTSAGAYMGGKCGNPGLNGCGTVFKQLAVSDEHRETDNIETSQREV
jgi:hypothetical protein